MTAWWLVVLAWGCGAPDPDGEDVVTDDPAAEDDDEDEVPATSLAGDWAWTFEETHGCDNPFAVTDVDVRFEDEVDGVEALVRTFVGDSPLETWRLVFECQLDGAELACEAEEVEAMGETGELYFEATFSDDLASCEARHWASADCFDLAIAGEREP